jgi:hypothetical protein
MATPSRVITKGGNSITGQQCLNLFKPVISLLSVYQKFEVCCV